MVEGIHKEAIWRGLILVDLCSFQIKTKLILPKCLAIEFLPSQSRFDNALLTRLKKIIPDVLKLYTSSTASQAKMAVGKNKRLTKGGKKGAKKRVYVYEIINNFDLRHIFTHITCK